MVPWFWGTRNRQDTCVACCSHLQFADVAETCLAPAFTPSIHTRCPQAEDFDEGVLYQLAQKRSEDEARAALRTLLGSDVSMLQVRGAWLW